MQALPLAKSISLSSNGPSSRGQRPSDPTSGAEPTLFSDALQRATTETPKPSLRTPRKTDESHSPEQSQETFQPPALMLASGAPFVPDIEVVSGPAQRAESARQTPIAIAKQLTTPASTDAFPNGSNTSGLSKSGLRDQAAGPANAIKSAQIGQSSGVPSAFENAGDQPTDLDQVGTTLQNNPSADNPDEAAVATQSAAISSDDTTPSSPRPHASSLLAPSTTSPASRASQDTSKINTQAQGIVETLQSSANPHPLQPIVLSKQPNSKSPVVKDTIPQKTNKEDDLRNSDPLRPNPKIVPAAQPSTATIEQLPGNSHALQQSGPTQSPNLNPVTPDRLAPRGDAASASPSQSTASLANTAPTVGQNVPIQSHIGNSPAPDDSAISQHKPSAVHEAPTSEGPPAMGTVQVARIVDRLGQSDMHIGLRTQAFGTVDVHTALRDAQVGLSLNSEKGDLRTSLGPELPALQTVLRQHDLRLADLTFSAHTSGNNAGSSGGSGAQPNLPFRRSTPADAWPEIDTKDNSPAVETLLESTHVSVLA